MYFIRGPPELWGVRGGKGARCVGCRQSVSNGRLRTGQVAYSTGLSGSEAVEWKSRIRPPGRGSMRPPEQPAWVNESLHRLIDSAAGTNTSFNDHSTLSRPGGPGPRVEQSEVDGHGAIITYPRVWSSLSTVCPTGLSKGPAQRAGRSRSDHPNIHGTLRKGAQVPVTQVPRQWPMNPEHLGKTESVTRVTAAPWSLR